MNGSVYERKYVEPYALKAKLLAWSELNINEIDMILYVFKIQNVNEIYNFLEKLFDLNSNVPKEKILIDLHYYAIKYAFDNGFSRIQLSSFISIIRALHRANQETPFDNYKYLYKYFQDLIVCHSIKRPPFCNDIFDTNALTKVINYISSTYLKHYKLYKYTFTPIVGLNLKMNYLNRTPSPTPDVEIYTNQNTESFNDGLDVGKQLSNFNSNTDVMSANNNLNVRKSADSMLSSAALESSNQQTQFMSAKQEMRNYVKNILTEHLESNDIKQRLTELKNEKLNQLNQHRMPAHHAKHK